MRPEYRQNVWRGNEYPLNFRFFSKSRKGDLTEGQQVGIAETFLPGVVANTLLIWWGESVRNIPKGMKLE